MNTQLSKSARRSLVVVNYLCLVIVLVIVLAHAVVYRLVPGMDFAISVPLAGSLVYLAHTLPGSVLAWTESEMPGAMA